MFMLLTERCQEYCLAIIIIIISTQTQVPVLKVITLQWDRINNFRFT